MSTVTRWRIAFLLNRFRSTCWAELVEYGLGHDRGYRTLRKAVGGNRSCRRDAAETGTCYCGKVATAALLDANPGCPRAAVLLSQEDVRRINESTRNDGGVVS